MFVWFAAGSAAIVWYVFQSPALDYRVVMVGAVLATVELPFGVGPLQTLLAAVVALGVVMGATVGRRLVRRRWLGIPIGMFLRLVLDGSWSDARVFWWPLRGWSFPDRAAPVVARGWWSVALEVLGVAAALWLWATFGLDDGDRRARFVHEGQLDRAHVGGGGART